MRQLTGTIRQAGNKAFEERVAADLRRFGMSYARNSLKRVDGLKLVSEAGEDLGDIDAIGLSQSARLIVVAEAKDFEMSRTPVELANEAEALLEGDKSAAYKVQRRANWVERHLDAAVRELTGKAANGRWRVVPVIVASRDLLTPRVATNASVAVVPIDALSEWVQKTLAGKRPGAPLARDLTSSRDAKQM
jgi:hypothetical protein